MIKSNIHLNKMLIIINILFITQLHSQQLKTYISEGLINQKTINSEIKKELKQIKKRALLKKDSTLLIKSLLSLSAYERSKINYEKAFINAGEALYIAQKFNSQLLIAKSNEEFGILLYMYKQDTDAEKHLLKAHKIYNSLYLENKLDIKNLYQSNYNLVLLSQLKKNSKELNKYISYCDTILKTNKLPLINHALLNEKKSSIEQWDFNYNKAIKLLEKSVETIKKLPNTNKYSKSFLSILYGKIGNIHHLSKNKILAEKFFKKAVLIQDYTGENTFYKYFIFKKYASLLAELGQYSDAYKYEAKSNTLGHSYWNPRNQKNSSFISIKNQFKDQLNTQNRKLSDKKLEITRIENRVLQLKTLILFITLASLMIVTIIVYRIKSIKHEKIEKDSEKQIRVKNKELTHNTLQLIEKERVITDLTKFLKENNHNTNSKLFLKRIHKNSSSLWESFNSRFKEQNIGFYEKLQKKIPNLTSSDLKLCALIKLNFSGKEMSYLLGISYGSVNVARHRLRKKMGLPKETNLTEFINTI